MSKKNRILFLGDLGGGGKERRMSELIRYLSENGQYELYLMLNRKTKKDYPQTLRYLNGYKEVDFRKGKRNVLYQIRDYFYEIKPVIVHSWHEILSLYIDVLKPFLPKFYYIAGFVADANKDSFIRGIADRFTYAISDKIISNSKAGLIAHHAPLGKSIVIYNGFNSDRIPKDVNAEELRHSLGVNDEKVVIMVGRMQRGKDYDTFLSAIKILNDTISGVKYLFIGQGEYIEQYQRRVEDERIANVIFTGFRNDVERIFSITDLTVQCTNESHKEGVSNVIMESMAMGVPVVATDAGGTPEIVENGRNGFLIKPQDEVALAELISNIISDKDLHNQLSQGCRETINERFTINKMVDEYLSIYQEALS